MTKQKPSLAQLNTRLSRLSIRERVLGTFVILTLLYSLGEIFLLSPLEQQRKNLNLQTEEAFSQIVLYQAEFVSQVKDTLQDPTLAARKELEVLSGKNRKIDLQLRKMEDGFTVRREPARLLQELLQENSGLRVIEVKKGKPEPYAFTGTVPESKKTNLFRQSVEIEMEGRFVAFLEYLQRVENSSLILFWDDLELRVVDHPYSRFVLKVHTLSPGKEMPNV